jgi:hypothetical protein
VHEIESAFTEPVSVDGLDRTTTLRVNVGLEDPLLRLEEGSRVQVTATVREVQETRTFEGLRIEAQGREARLTPSRVAVTIAGPAARVRALERSELKAYVTLPREGPVPPRLPVAIDLGSGHAGLGVLETRPAEVAVRLSPPGRRP